MSPFTVSQESFLAAMEPHLRELERIFLEQGLSFTVNVNVKPKEEESK